MTKTSFQNRLTAQQAKMARTVLLTTDWKAQDTGAVNGELLDNIGPNASTGRKLLISFILFCLCPAGIGFVLLPAYVIWAFFGGKKGNGVTAPATEAAPATQPMSAENTAKVADLKAQVEIAELQAKLAELQGKA